MTTSTAETLEDQHTSEQQQQQQQEDQEGEGSELLLLEAPDDVKDEEFSFVCLLDLDTSSSSPISAADDLFHDGQIRAPLYPLFNQAALIFDNNDDHHHQSTSPCRPQLRKIFIEHPTSPCSSSSSKHTPTETALCEWSGKKSSSPSSIASSSSPDRCKKSNSTGFSKLWRFRDLLHRSSSDGKDTFVFLHHHHHPPSTVEASSSSSSEGKYSDEEGANDRLKGKAKKVKGTTKTEKHIVSAHEMHYMRNRVVKEEEKRRSYLPYKVGFFTSASGFSRNLHPF